LSISAADHFGAAVDGLLVAGPLGNVVFSASIRTLLGAAQVADDSRLGRRAFARLVRRLRIHRVELHAEILEQRACRRETAMSSSMALRRSP